jgi:hypothetical protein
MKNTYVVIASLQGRFDSAAKRPNTKNGLLVNTKDWRVVQAEIERLRDVIRTLGGDPDNQSGIWRF